MKNPLHCFKYDQKSTANSFGRIFTKGHKIRWEIGRIKRTSASDML